MSRPSPTAAARAAHLAPVLLLAAPLALAQQSPDPVRSFAPAPQADVKTYGPSTLTPEVQAQIALRDAADRAASADAPARREASEPRLEHTPPTAGLVDRLEHVLVDATADPGSVWALGRGWKAEFAPSGLTYYPRLGKSAPRNMPTSFELARITRGGEGLGFRAGDVRAAGHSVVLDRGSLREVYHLALESLEQTFVFDTLAGEGDLVLDLAVTSEWQVVPGEEHIRFVDPAYGEVRYGRAYALDATGAKIELAREWTGDGIALTVPAAFLAGAVLPLTVDPVIGSTTTFTSDDDESNPDACFDSASNRYYVAFQDYFSATDADVFVVDVSTTGVVGSTIEIDFTVDYWAQPSVAASPASDNLLVVASTTPDGPGSANADIEGRFVDTSMLAVSGAQFVIDTQTGDCVRPDVGGSWWSGAAFADYCVVWQREFSATDHDILARVVNQDGTFLTSTIFLSNSGSDDYGPAVSKSRGDESFFGDFWNIAWIRDNEQDGLGTPIMHRIYFDGTVGTATEQVVFNTALASDVDVSSTFDTVVPGINQRPFLVVFERDVNNRDIYATVCTELGPETTSNVSDLEDFDVSLITRNPCVATDGTSFFLAFDELWYNAAPNSTDYDTYALSGNIAYEPNGAFIALSERHARLQFAGGLQRRCEIASQGDGGGTADDALVAWEDRFSNGANGGTITFAIFDSATLDSSAFQAIGEQYCTANAHDNSGDGGRRSSFIVAVGNASVNSSQTLVCTEMKLNAFAYFIVSATAGNVNLPGGSQGRLCLGGTIGRRVGGNVLFTGSGGEVSTPFDPQALPTPTGTFAAAPGQTLYFQCWHRDLTPGGTATSNFSNACSVVFRP